MITKMNRLGCLLFAVLSLFIVGGVTLVVTDHISYLAVIALSVVVLFLCTTFMGYLLHDIYTSKQEKYLQDLKKSQE